MTSEQITAPGRPVISDASRQRINEIIARCHDLTPRQRAVIGGLLRSGRRLGRTPEPQEASAA